MSTLSHDEAVLSTEDLTFFEDNGYVLLRQAVPPENIDPAIDAIFEFLEMDRHDRSDWYRDPLSTMGMIEMYHHQAMWNNRQSPRIYAAFTQLWGTPKLWVNLDRMSFKPPHNDKDTRWNHKGFLHIDAQMDEPRPLRFGLQGVLALADTTPEQGGFHCLPGWHKPEKQEQWAELVKDEERPSFYADDIPWHLGVTPVEMNAGDMVIWHRALPHGNGLNRTDRPRIAQYINMRPAREDDEQRMQDRVRQWRERVPPDAPWVQGDPRNWEPTHGKTAELSPLGRKLLGLDPWG
ncbi:MAG: phytanoyl-CoA dioxygenase family protein [Phycisphaeraceae bacterium]